MRKIQGILGFVHSIESAASLSDAADLLLLVSPRTLYVLQNLAQVDAAYLSRWGTAFNHDQYEPVHPNSNDELFVHRAVEEMRLELMPLNPDLVSVLEELVAAITAGGGTSVNCGTGAGLCQELASGTSLANCISNMEPEDFAEVQPVEAPEVGVPPDGFATWAEYTAYKCSAAWALIYAIERMCDNMSVGSFITLFLPTITSGLLLAVVGTGVVFPPSLIVAFLGSVVAMAALSTTGFVIFRQVAAYYRAHEEELVCQLYRSGSAAAAIDAMGNVTEDAIQAINWGGLAALSGGLAPLIGGAMAIFESNSFVNPLFHLLADVVSVGQECNCIGDCGQFVKFGTFNAGVYSSASQSGEQYLEVQFNAEGDGQWCGDAVTIVDVALLSGSLTDAQAPIWRVYNQGFQIIVQGMDEPTWAISNVGDLTITSHNAFTVSIDWF